MKLRDKMIETTVAYAELKAIIVMLIVGAVGGLALYLWYKNHKVEG